ncbi:MAG: hypothetical protein Q8N56_02530 [bacterium]|nr:hypothetical protein [bacterium]
MNSKLFTYAFAKTLYEQKRDYIDTFYSFVLIILPEDRSPLNIGSIQTKVKDKFGLDIPEHSLKSIITRAKKKNYLIENKWNAKLTEKGIKYLELLESESEVNRRINELLEDIKIYLNETQLSLEDINTIVLTFVNKNIYSLISFFNPVSDVIKVDIQKKKIRKYEDKLVQYFEIAEKQKPNLYRTLQDIVYGSVISTATSSQNIAEIDKKFKGVNFYLDTNYIFSILELHYSEFVKPAKELLSLLKSNEVELKVFDFTIDEIVSVLKNYLKEQYMYVPGVRVNSIYSSLKSESWTTEDMMEFIQKIEAKLYDLSIKIEPTGIELKSYKPKKEEFISKILGCKPEQNERGRNHDLAAIEQIERIRGKPVREIERSKALFLTSDLRLSSCNYSEWGHRENMTVCEVVPDRLLANILWLKNPATIKDIPLKSIIAIHSREILVDRKIWKRFYENAKRLKEQNQINDKDLSMIFYNHYIEGVLSKLDESDVDKVTTELILEEIANASKSIDSETKNKLKEQTNIFEEQIIQKDIEIERVQKKLEGIKSSLRMRIQRKIKKYVNIFSWIIVFILFIILFKSLPLVINKWNVIEPLVWLVSIFISIALPLLGRKIALKRLREGLENRIFNKIYRKKINELEITYE